MRKGPKTHHVVPNPKNGQISRSDSLGNDPFPPKGLHCLEIEIPDGGKQ